MSEDGFLSASEIGKAAWCPHGASLQARGCKPDARHKERTERGKDAHARLTQAVVAGEDRRCFVASYALGPDHGATQQLRVWRDETLKPRVMGRLFISVYYGVSPWLIRVLGRVPGFKLISRWVVLKLASCVTKK
jgi:hypothetical protein